MDFSVDLLHRMQKPDIKWQYKYNKIHTNDDYERIYKCKEPEAESNLSVDQNTDRPEFIDDTEFTP